MICEKRTRLPHTNIAVLFLSIICFRCYPQFLLVAPDNSPEEFFNTKIVAEKKIKTIKGYVSSKPDNDIIMELGITKGYEFDTLGNATRIYIARSSSSGAFDTTATNLFYNSDRNIILKRTNNDGVFYDSRYYEYDKNKKVKKETRCRETNANLTGPEFRLGVQLILSQETFKYDSLTPTQFKKLYYNDENRVYRQGIINTDSSGRPVEEIHSFAVGWVKTVNGYKYDKQGAIIERTTRSNENGDVKEMFAYEYDHTGNLVAEKKYKNDTQLYEMSYLYDEEKKLLKSTVARFYLEKRIEIVKYSYEFYR